MIRGRKLVLRIYLIGLAQMAALAVTFAIAREANRPRTTPHEPETRFLVEQVLAGAGDDRAELQKRLEGLKQRTRIEVELRDQAGAVVASTQERSHGPAFSMAWQGGTARVHIAPPAGRRPPPDDNPGFFIAAVLVLVGISALLTAAWLGRPLGALSDAARELGHGNLAARVPLHRNDELGDVAVAFNEMAERLEQLVRGQRELLANVSHELRTPIARIRVALDLLAEGQSNVSLEGISGDLAELQRLTDDILTSARLELSSAHPPLRVERTEARALVEDAAQRFRKAHPSRALAVQDATADAQLDVDPMLLRRALDNLLDNAAKYSSDEVQLSATAPDGEVVVEVRDRGAGMSPEDLAALFTPFFRADRSRARQTGGLGLGLLLAKRIVEAHGGALQIESAPGKGTLARLRVPRSSQG